MAERFSRGRHQANDTSGPPKPRPPPSSVLDKEVQRYFDGPLHQKELSHWQQLSEIPTARELLRPQYVLIDDSHLQEPSDAQNGWEADNTWVEGDGSQCDQSATNWEAPNWDDVRMRQTAKNTDFAQATDSNWDAPAPISEWDAPAPLVDGELASGIDPKASASASPINESNDVDDAPQSSDTETPAHKPEASEPGEEMGTSNSQDDSNNQQPSEDAPAEESSAEQATQVTPADTTADGEDSTSSTTVGDAMVNPRDDDDNADLDSQEPPRLQAFNSLGPWASKKKYLRTHYMLLREEALRHLKEAIQILRINSTMTERDGDRSIGIYDGVSLLTCAYN